MATTVLGKRNRDSDSRTVLPSSASSRVKRRSQVHVHVDGDEQHLSTEPEVSESTSPNRQQISNNKFANAARARSRRNFTRSPCTTRAQAQAPETFEEDENHENHIQLPTPKTPRHRDALSKKVPITPRHRIGLVGKPVTPRFTRTPLTNSNAPTVYDAARQLFDRNTDPGRLVGRTEERDEVCNFIQQGVDSKAGGCLYVSGPPGTGKSALVGEVCKEMDEKAGLISAYINCMSVESSGEVCQKLVDKLLGEERFLGSSDLEALQALFLHRKKTDGPTYIVTLDEIDHLLNLDLEIIYTLFEWSLQQSSRLIIIGIANALDLTDRFLPRLKARNLKPQLLPFLPYTADQIAEVITTKLCTLLTEDAHDQVNFVPFLHPAAIQLCSKKVASQTGDLRKAFDIMRRTIDLVESETNQKLRSLETSPSKMPLAENPNISLPSCSQGSSAAPFTSFTAPRATIAHVSRIAAAALSNGTSQRLASLNLQQKAALCALISHQAVSHTEKTSIFMTPSRTTKPLPPTVRMLFETYYSLCRKENTLPPLTATEFADVISGLETLGLIGEERKMSMFGMKPRTPSRKGKGMGGLIREDRRLVCFVDEKEVQDCQDGVGGAILRRLLSRDA